MEPMTYKRIVVVKRGSPENMRIEECDLRDPKAKEIRVKVLACPVCGPDVQNRNGHSPFPPKVPYEPGCAIVGAVDAVGPGVAHAVPGATIAAWPSFGGYGEYLFLPASRLVPVPPSLHPVEAAPVVLNYLTAYQVLHRRAKVKAGDKVLLIGASGGCGTALLDLGRLAGLKMYGLASGGKRPILAQFGAIPIDYRNEDFVDVIRRAEPDGLDCIIDGMGGDYISRAFPLLRRGGVFVEYSNPGSFRGMLRLLRTVLVLNLLPNGRKIKAYGAGAVLFNRKPFLEDWAILFRLLEEGKIRPVISGEFPLLDAAKANALFESGQVVGNLVLAAPELLGTRQPA
ncbi:MAG: zinc-binding dehydrogenase [Terracidiphilus sp.]|jgi:NADPH:quinone reductase-like Zn-dependent oxidoreductase